MARASSEVIQAEARAFHASERVWSDLVAAEYGRPGSNGYDRGRYRTPYAEWSPAIQAAYDVRDLARRAWEAATGLS